MQQFDYNKYIKNNPLLKEVDEKAPWEKFRKPEDNPNTLLGLLQKQYPNFPFQKYRKKSGKYDIPMSIWNKEVGLTPQELQKMAKQANAMGLANTWNIYGDPKRAGYMNIDISDPRRPMPSIHGTFWNPDADINERDIEEAKNVKKDGDETWFSDENYFKKEHEGYKLKPTDMVAIGDGKAMTYAQAVKKFGGAMKEAKKKNDETWFSDVNYFKKEHEGYKLKPTDMVSIGDIPSMTYAQAVKKFGKVMKEAPKEVEEAQSVESTDDYEYFVQKGLKKGEFAHITAKTKVVVGNQVVTKYSGQFGEIVKIVGDKYIVADDAWGDKSQNSRKNLEKYYLLVIK